MIIGIMLILGIVGFIVTCVGGENDSGTTCALGIFMMIASVIILIYGCLHGFIDYNESNDKDLARITSVTQEQTAFRTYYIVEVEYLTNTPTQQGVVQSYNIEKDTFYCYYEDKELVEKLKNNMYQELWIITGYKGGYESWKDFGNKLIKDIELKEN